MNRARSFAERLVFPALGVVLLIVLRSVLVQIFPSLSTFPPASVVIAKAWEQLREPALWENVGASGFRWMAGLGLAIIIGVPLGILMGRNRLAFNLIDPLLTAMYPVPKAALILLLLLIWGPGNLSRITVITIGSLIPIIISAYHGAQAVEPKLIWSARSLGYSNLRIGRSIVAPAALPSILSGLRLAIGISIFVLIGAELLVRESGIGYYLFAFYDVGLNDEVWGVTVVIALLGWLIDFLYVRGVRFFVPWFDGDV